MVFTYEGQEFLTDDDLDVSVLGRYPEIFIQNPELRKIFEENFGRNFLGGDEIISYRQALVSKGMSFNALEEEILAVVKRSGVEGLRKAVFDKTGTGIGRGHSLGGLSGIVLGITGTKMIDSGLTGLVASRSLVTSGRRRTVKESDIIVPESISRRPELLREYLEISRQAFAEAADFESRFGKLGGIETFNKTLPYNNPADLFIVLPLDTMATLAFEVMADKFNPNGPFLPREIHTLVEMFPGIADENGLGTMYRQRIRVPRGTYLHYNVFKDPSLPNDALDLAQELGMPSEPRLIDAHIDLTKGFKRGLENLRRCLEETRRVSDPEQLAEAAMRAMLASRELTTEYNEAVRATVIDQLSFRVWSEQKRHATLRQVVESIYSAASRHVDEIREIWPEIEAAYRGSERAELPLDKLEKIMVIDSRLRKSPELLIPYVYHAGRQLMFFDRLVREGIPLRDAAYMIPRNILTRNLENYDLINLIDLELPLRLCISCEPERHATSWQKRNLIAKALPDLDYFLQPKCGVGYCTEKEFCGHMGPLRGYDQGLHGETKAAMLGKAKP